MEWPILRDRWRSLAALVLSVLLIPHGGSAQSPPPPPPTPVSATAPLQGSTLVAIKLALDPPNAFLKSWVVGAACNMWTGVTCDSSNNVVQIKLTYASLTGTIPPQLGSLTTLTSLNLSANWLTGNIPETLYTLKNLQILDLRQNLLDGPIPANIGNLTALETLDLYSNSLNGSLPSSIAALTNLTMLNVGRNNLEGPIPDLFGGLTKLTTLKLLHNYLNGTIPASVAALPAVQMIDLSRNRLEGSVNAGLGFLTTLKYLNLSGNVLSGEIPGGFAAAASPITTLDLSSNSLSGEIPTWARSNLLHLDLSSNDLTGHLVPSLATPPPRLLSLKLSYNRLEGPLPAEFASLADLKILNLASNFLSGSLPANLSACTNMTILDLSFNLFSGPLPPSYAAFPKLQQLLAGSNTLQAPLDFYDFSHLPACVRLSLANNQFTGGLPRGLPKILRTLDLSYNNLEGQINGSVFDNLSLLVSVLLSGNELTGGLPYQLWNGSALQLVAVNNNSLTIAPTYKLTSNLAQGLSYLLLGGNPICDSSTFPGSTYPTSLCNVPSGASEPWTPSNTTLNFPANCYTGDTPNCYGQEFPSIPYYNSTGGECLCSLPLNVTILLENIVYVVHGETFDLLSASLRTMMSTLTGVDFIQIWVIEAEQVSSQGSQLVTLQYYGASTSNNATPRTVNTTMASQVISLLQTGPYLGPAWGSITLVSSTLTPSAAAIQAEAGAGSGSLQTWIIILIVVVGSLVALLLVLFVWWFFVWRNRYQGDKKSKFDREIEQFFVRHIKLAEILAATDNFSESHLLGEGGFGTVYKGVPVVGPFWAVKRAKGNMKTGALEEFQKEVRAISRFSHNNVVKLVGYCDEGKEQILVYEFCENGTLKHCLRKTGKEALSLEQRLEIAIGAAEGLRYLHEFATPAIIHRDIKSENILLDERLQAKVADFGLLKDLPKGGGELDERSEGVAGTPGYIDPEYFLTFRVTPKSDVYSFGVVLLELLSGKPAVFDDPRSTENGRIGLASWASPYIRLKEFGSVTDPALDGTSDVVEAMLRIACDCVERLSLNRPDMAEVANRLGVLKAKATIAAREELSSQASGTSGRTDGSLLYLDSSFSTSFSSFSATNTRSSNTNPSLVTSAEKYV